MSMAASSFVFRWSREGELYFDEPIRKDQSKSLDRVQAGPVCKMLQVSFSLRWRTLSRILVTAIPASCGPGSIVGIATGYGLDGLGIESWWG